MNNILYKKNLKALSILSSEVAKGKKDISISIETARNRSLVPIIIAENSDRLQLHSLFNPEAEAEKLYLGSRKEGGFVIIYGLGGGYHITPYLKDVTVENILVIDTGINYLHSLLEKIDFTEIFLNSKIDILIDPDYSVLESVITEKYLPTISGNLDIFHLKNRVLNQSDFFSKITEQINAILKNISVDFASQAFFGKRWFKNIIGNLPYAQETKPFPFIKLNSMKKKAAVIGAGTSLEKQIKHLKSACSTSILIATDTSVKYLLANNIVPDFIVSIDCQHITYNHLLGSGAENIPIIMDIGSPLFLSRFFKNRIYFASGNPLAKMTASKWRNFQFIDTAGGNVGYSAVAVSLAIGITDITLYGIDYSYLNYKPYCRDTFIYKHFDKKSNRLNSSENSVFSFAVGSNLYQTEKKGVFSNSLMDFYYNSMNSFVKKSNAFIRTAPEAPREIFYSGSGRENIIAPPFRKHIQPHSCEFAHRDSYECNYMQRDTAMFSDRSNNVQDFHAPISSMQHWSDFLIQYKSDLKALPLHLSDTKESFNSYFSRLSNKERELWATLFPVCATIRKEMKNKKVSAAEILSITKNWSLNEIEKTLTFRKKL